VTARFALEESSWQRLRTPDDLHALLNGLVERLEAAQEREEGVAKHSDFYTTQVGSGPALFSALFEPDCPLLIERDLGERFRLQLDRAATFDDSELASYDATFCGTARLAPGAAWAHSRRGVSQAVAVLPLASEPELRGPLAVTVGGVERQVHFVTNEVEHRAFFRAAIVVEGGGHEELKFLAGSAFPDLEWLPTVWQELKVHKGSFFHENLPTTLTHLGALNDHGARIFHENPGGEDAAIHLGSLGVVASSENGKARKYKPSIDDRTRPYQGKACVFWWHTKIRYNDGRIHFLHVPAKAPESPSDHGRIVIGIMKNHCTLPD
jgi:hypothetical protein